MVIPAFCSHLAARILALISTGKVMKLNKVVMAKRTMPPSIIPGNVCIVKMPKSNTHCIQLDANDTTGTRLERIFSGAYALAC